MLVSFSARFSECAFRCICLFGVCVSVFLAILDILVPASFNLFCSPVHVCPVFVLSCTVYVGVGVQFPQSVSVLVYCPSLLCVVLDFKSGDIIPPYWGPAIHCKHKKLT